MTLLSNAVQRGYNISLMHLPALRLKSHLWLGGLSIDEQVEDGDSKALMVLDPKVDLLVAVRGRDHKSHLRPVQLERSRRAGQVLLERCPVSR